MEFCLSVIGVRRFRVSCNCCVVCGCDRKPRLSMQSRTRERGQLLFCGDVVVSRPGMLRPPSPFHPWHHRTPMSNTGQHVLQFASLTVSMLEAFYSYSVIPKPKSIFRNIRILQSNTRLSPLNDSVFESTLYS